MSFQNIILPRSAIAEIYKDNLVDSITAQNRKTTEENINESSGLKFLGKNLKNILVMVHYPDLVYLPEEHLDFLTKILTACKLDIGHIAILNTAKHPANVDNIKTLAPETILVFGDCVSIIKFENNQEFFLPIKYEDISVISSPGLEKFYPATSESKQLKSRLWTCLQQYFKL